MRTIIAATLAILQFLSGPQCLAQPSPAQPGIFTVTSKNAGDVVDSCTVSFADKSKIYTKLICMGWIDGVADGANFQSQADRAKPSICLPKEDAHDKIVATFAQFVADHPDSRKAPAAIILMVAVAEKFPCGKS